eukprot:309424-Hanusia_phi.AAC.4
MAEERHALLKVAVKMGRAGKNDEAAVLLQEAIDLSHDAKDEVYEEAKENLLVIVNRLFQPIQSFAHLGNGNYTRFLEDSIRALSPHTVYDIGGGNCACVGSLMAIEAGAKKVFVYETLKIRSKVVQKLIDKNGFNERIKIVNTNILDQRHPVELQRLHPPDTLLMDITGSFGQDILNGDLLPSLIHMQRNGFLNEKVNVFPKSISLWFSFVESTSIAEMEEVRQQVEGFDLSCFNAFSRSTRSINLKTIPHRLLSSPQKAFTIDLNAIARGKSSCLGQACTRVVDLEGAGVVHGLVYWYEVEGYGSSFNLGPAEDQWTWQMLWLYALGAEYIESVKGRRIEISLNIDADGLLGMSLKTCVDPIFVSGYGFYSPTVTNANTSDAVEDEEEEELDSDGNHEVDPFTLCEGIPLYHFSMINDLHRASAYHIAIQRAVSAVRDRKASVTVLDVGCGSGLLSMMAARAGSDMVYGCDKAPGMADCARRVVKENGLQDFVKIIPKLSTTMMVGSGDSDDMSGKADIFVSETFGDDPFSESFLPTLQHARENLLVDEAVVVPRGIRVYALGIQSEEILHLNKLDSSHLGGLDIQDWDIFSRSRWSCRLLDHSFVALTEPFEAFVMDWSDPSKPMQLKRCETRNSDAVNSGDLHAFVVWYNLEMIEGCPDISTDCHSSAMTGRHWRQAVYFMKDPIRVTKGDRISVTVSLNRDRLFFKIASLSEPQ